MKDNFSSQPEAYARFRPRYPRELFDHLLSLVKNKTTAWDCGTGNGQVAGELADYFTEVFATDISRRQLEEAVQKKNIYYSVQPAEKTDFAANSFDLITVAQAIHWFAFEEFYAEVKRVLKPGGLLAVIGYGLLETDSEIQNIILHFYKNIIAAYWDAERKYIDENYATIPFPFDEIKMPRFDMCYEWTFHELIGYLGTWSAVKHYIKQNGTDPVEQISNKIKQCWGDAATHRFHFPLLLRAGY